MSEFQEILWQLQRSVATATEMIVVQGRKLGDALAARRMPEEELIHSLAQSAKLLAASIKQVQAREDELGSKIELLAETVTAFREYTKLDLFHEAPDPFNIRIRALAGIGHSLELEGRLEEALSLLSQALERLKSEEGKLSREDHQAWMAYFHLRVAGIYTRRGDQEQAAHSYERALKCLKAVE